MSELSTDELALLSEAVDTLIKDLETLLNATEAGSQPVKLKDNQGRLSRMDEMHNQSILNANRTLSANRLKAAKLSKARLAEGLFGVCQNCDEPIAFNRLMAYPDASLCIQCQSDVEAH